MHRHLVAVKVGVVGSTNQRMNFQSPALNQNWLKSLNAQAVQSRRAVQQNGVLADNILQHIPNLRPHAFHHPLSALNIMRHIIMHQALHHKRLEKLQRHLLRQAALVHFQLRPNHDNRTAGVINTFAQQVLAETPLFAFQQIGKRFQRPVARAHHGAAAAAVINQRVHSLLQHPLFIAHNNIRRAQIQQTMQTVVAVNHPAIKVVQIAGGKTSAIKLHHGA